MEHKGDSITGKWKGFGATEHSKDCHEPLLNYPSYMNGN